MSEAGEVPKNLKPDRFEIGERNRGINGGIWIGIDGTNTFVDTAFDKQLRLGDFIERNIHPLAKNKTGEGVLSSIPKMARILIPINKDNYKTTVDAFNMMDRYGLEMFLSNKQPDGTEVGGGGSDQQALLIGLFMEEYYKVKYPIRSLAVRMGLVSTPKVGISRNKDSFAVVKVVTRKGNKFEFDPGRGDTKFVHEDK